MWVLLFIACTRLEVNLILSYLNKTRHNINLCAIYIQLLAILNLRKTFFIRYRNKHCPQRLNNTSLQILTDVYRSCIRTILTKYYQTQLISMEHVFRLLVSCWFWCQEIWGYPHGLVLSCSPYDCLGHNHGCEIFTGPLGLLKIHRRLQDWTRLGLVNGVNFTRAQTHRHTHFRSKSCYDQYTGKGTIITFPISV